MIVAEQKPISISVMGDPESGTRFLNKARESRRVGASAVGINVEPIGRA